LKTGQANTTSGYFGISIAVGPGISNAHLGSSKNITLTASTTAEPGLYLLRYPGEPCPDRIILVGPPPVNYSFTGIFAESCFAADAGAPLAAPIVSGMTPVYIPNIVAIP
jgi:hypothetical protein